MPITADSAIAPPASDAADWRQAQAEARMEAERLAALIGLDVLDTPPEPAFDRLVASVAARFAAPIVFLALVDAERHWLKSAIGMPTGSERLRDQTFCDHTIRQSSVLVVPDASADPRFLHNPLVTGTPGIRFYAGAPLEMPEGARLGTLCVIDFVPRQDFSAEDRADLQRLAGEAVTALRRRQQG